jgi:hypothetical protein
LQFSRGLKKLYEISDISDDELVQQQDEDAFLLGSLTLPQWRTVCKAEARGVLLEIAANSDWEGVLRAVDSFEAFLKRVSPVPPDDALTIPIERQ